MTGGLPTGVVTFMFTDIEGSTRLVRALGDAYPQVLGEHDRLLGTMIAEHGGVAVNTEGDAFFAVFTSPERAVAAAASVQRALASAAWASDPPVRVRIGLHTGQGILGGSDYVGLDVHVAARVAAAGHGGQTLVTDATRDAVEGHVPEGIGLRALGAYRLKDLEGPLRLHQVTGHDLASEFPPLRAGRSGSLPEPRTPFVGRSDEIHQLEEILDEARLLVLTGAGGTGKTRLALELARRVADRFPDGAFFVPLEATRDASSVEAAILDALQAPVRARTVHDALREILAPLELLLVLDNLEQVEGIGPIVDALLQSAPKLTIIGTSRMSLRVYGEHEFHVPPLALPPERVPVDVERLLDVDAVSLFVDRARRARGAFELTPANADVVAEICRRLDGLPLAIELAAARVRLLSPDAILARLDAQLKLLEDNAPNLPARQRSLRGAIEWSYELLGEPERALLRRLSVFVGGWDLDAAGAAYPPDERGGRDILEGIGALLDQSLVERDDTSGDPRFRMLHAIRDYGHERLVAAGEADATARRHAEHFRAVLEAAEPHFTGAEPAAAVGRVVPDQQNVHAALEWCIDHDAADPGLAIAAAAWRLWQLRGQLTVGRRFLDALLALPSASEPTIMRARALTAVGGVMYWQGDPETAARYAQALEVYQAVGDEAGIAESHNNLGFAHLTARPARLEEGLRQFSESLRRYETLGDARMVASVTGSIGFAHLGLGNLDAAREALERALALNTAGGFRPRAADNHFVLGNLNMEAGSLTDAAARYRRALGEAVEMEDRTRTLTFLSAVAGWAAESGDVDTALRLSGAIRHAAGQQGGIMTGGPGIVDAVEVARRSGMSEDLIGERTRAGEEIELADAVAQALDMLDSSAADLSQPAE